MPHTDRMDRSWISPLLALMTVIGLGCTNDSVTPNQIDETRAPADLNILQFDQVPTLINDSVSFWAVRGQHRAVEMFFSDSVRLLRFEVGASSLSRFPDGRLFAGTDSVLITIRLTDPATLAFEFEPSGLQFKSGNPAELTVAYDRALSQPSPGLRRSQEDDDDGDGDDEDSSVDDDDPSAEGDLGIWVQEQANSPYTRLPSRVDTILNEIAGDVPGFSRYAIAY